MILIPFLLLVSCGLGENRLFNRKVLFTGISENLDDYVINPAFEIYKTGPITKEEAAMSPDHWYEADNEEILLVFWPTYSDEIEYNRYRLQIIDVKQKTKKYFLGRFIGMTSNEVFRKYYKPDGSNNVPIGENHIFFFNKDQSEFIRLWLHDDVVIRAAWAYTIDERAPKHGGN